ncbi:MAG: type II secretion system protein [Candidatus Riflebacteria bacterium]|nr:type II secretion system protein [Candidatus Riflebacteria bacterium]
MELLLVVGILAVITPIILPPIMSNMATQRDLSATQQVINTINHARSMGLLGRSSDATLNFSNASNTIGFGMVNSVLSYGYMIGNIKVNSALANSANIVFDIVGNVTCNNIATSTVSVDIIRPDSTVLTTVNISGMGIPFLTPSAIGNSGGNSGNTGINSGRGCTFSWL